MVIVRMCGGIGNQMFCYALGTSLKKRNIEVKYDINSLEECLNNYNWDSIFNIFSLEDEVASVEEISALSDTNMSLVSRVRRKLFGRKASHYFEKYEGKFTEEVYNLDDRYIDGYWQSYKYFQDIKSTIFAMFEFPKLYDKKNTWIEKKITECNNSVSIHIRRGDYIDDANYRLYGGICTDDYYKKSVEYFKAKHPDVHFFVFSNDKEYIERFSENEEYTIVNSNNEKNAWADMYLMSICKNNIIANSTFSWWGAWLNKNEEKEVIAPRKWMNSREMPDLIPPEWIKI